MFFKLNGKTYSVKFSRQDKDTFATLFVVDESGALVKTDVEGSARLYYKDTFEKSKGRKVALADLLWHLSVADAEGAIPEGLSKEDRQTIWAEYFRTHKK